MKGKPKYKSFFPKSRSIIFDCLSNLENCCTNFNESDSYLIINSFMNASSLISGFPLSRSASKRSKSDSLNVGIIDLTKS